MNARVGQPLLLELALVDGLGLGVGPGSTAWRIAITTTMTAMTTTKSTTPTTRETSRLGVAAASGGAGWRAPGAGTALR
jgi:hypothetical protein